MPNFHVVNVDGDKSQVEALVFSLVSPFKVPGGRISIERDIFFADASFEFDDPRFDLEMDATVSGGAFRDTYARSVDQMTGSEENPFAPKSHFKANSNRELISFLLHHTEDESCEHPVGYGTMSASFHREDADEDLKDEAGDRGVSVYDLALTLDAVFVSEPERGQGYGLWLSAALAQVVSEAIVDLARQAFEREVSPRVDLVIYFELHSMGGEAAFNIFRSHLIAFWEQLPDMMEVEGDMSLVTGSIDFDGGW
ncbi:hypothetical protein ACOI1H_20305 [Loktanella sp. DJP18]|uniref:hypothetical protein n=1 Tax=Loktanella sp. DJP18 TaxID=3409788 RepID=UPI003BB56658